MIQYALNWYRNNNTIMRQNSRRLYNQRRRILKKYNVIQSHKFTIKHRNLYMNNLNKFRQIIREWPDYVCISCRLALFHNHVISFVEEKERKWICKLCLDKIKKRQIPTRAIVNKLPFMKIVNLTSGKLSTRLAQKGTKGSLHCVPSDVQVTVTALSRPVDKSMMVRLQLKRRLNESIIESMDVDTNEEENLLEETEISDKNRLKALALYDIENNTNSDEELDEDNKDIRTKYNIGTDSCAQPCDFNDFFSL
ncbi:unnamed protein product [Rotaria sp. Silwood1]|nr:unnamed protein product [Rotaria sp. Silwood1]